MNAKWRRLLRSTVITLIFIIVTVAAAGTWYKLTYSMKPVVPREIKDKSLPVHILIATQGSEFKDKVVAGVIDKLSDRPIYIKIIDVADLGTITPQDWTAIVIIHTWEVGEPPKSVPEFIRRTNAGDVIVLTTSGDGNYHIEGVDGITSASKLSDVDRCVREILNRIEIKIAPEEISIQPNR